MSSTEPNAASTPIQISEEADFEEEIGFEVKAMKKDMNKVNVTRTARNCLILSLLIDPGKDNMK